MSKFIIPKVKSSHRDYVGECQNNPVNIDLCIELIKIIKIMDMVKNILLSILRVVM